MDTLTSHGMFDTYSTGLENKDESKFITNLQK
jgi:hypothetical protein